jgi:tetratricopeptide (TPR) repeat protein
MGCLLAAVGQTEEAMKQFYQALRIDDNYADAHCNLGRLLAQLGRRDEAVAHLTEALRLKPDYADAKQQLRELGAPAPQ